MNPIHYFRKQSRAGRRRPQAHMTWGSRSISQSVTTAGMFLKKQLWVWPIIAVVVLSVVGFTVRSAIESTMKANLKSQLHTLLNVETAMLTTWFEVQESNAESLANDAAVREIVYRLLQDTDEAPVVEERLAIDKALQKELAPAMASHEYVGYFVADNAKHIISTSHAALSGQNRIPEFDDWCIGISNRPTSC